MLMESLVYPPRVEYWLMTNRVESLVISPPVDYSTLSDYRF